MVKHTAPRSACGSCRRSVVALNLELVLLQLLLTESGEDRRTIERFHGLLLLQKMTRLRYDDEVPVPGC